TDFAIAKQMYAQDLMEEAESRYSKIDTFSRVGQFVFSNFIPFWQWGSTYNATGWGTNNFLMGNNIKEQVETFGLLPLEEATKGLREAFEAIWARNPDDAMYFLRAFQGMDSWDVSLGNFVSVADMAAVGGSIPALRAARALKNVGKTAL